MSRKEVQSKLLKKGEVILSFSIGCLSILVFTAILLLSGSIVAISLIIELFGNGKLYKQRKPNRTTHLISIEDKFQVVPSIAKLEMISPAVLSVISSLFS
jgi:hypothetical protein